MQEARRFLVTGLVQGVGFRPAVWHLARELGLTGWVRNGPAGVDIHLEGPATVLDDFATRLPGAAPALARIDSLKATDAARQPHRDFRILDTAAASTGENPGRHPVSTAIGPDLGVCPDCLAELFDPASRRYRYPLLACTHCGPRYTVTRQLPYSRAATSLAPFPLCPACSAEYGNPADRRFHAETMACPDCGPAHRLLDASGQPLPGDPVAGALALLRQGGILALKGLGGFHLACDARNPAAVARLRQRKNREAKPFALLAANLASLAGWASCDAGAAQLLQGPARPIVLLPIQTKSETLFPGVAPGLAHLGVMLPATPMQWLLFHEAAGRPASSGWTSEPQELLLVMTSANPGGEPLVTGNTEAQERLAGIADAYWLHDRDIVVRCDDSVVRGESRVESNPQSPLTTHHSPLSTSHSRLRHGRGYTPEAIPLTTDGPDVLALGAWLKNAICLTRGRQAFLSQHIGSLDNAATYAFLEETVAHLLATLEVRPAAVAHDLHPDFPSTRLALELAERLEVPACGIAHHHAHIAAVCCEHGVTGPVLGLALDGVGLGPDGGLWGGELLRVQGSDCQRLGHLAHLALPGGDKAAREPWRLAVALLHRAGAADRVPGWLARRFPGRDLGPLLAMLDKGINCPPTSSLGRLFDAAAALLGLRAENCYEAQAAMELEALAWRHGPAAPDANGFLIQEGRLDLTPLLLGLAEEADPARGAARFHTTLVLALSEWAAWAAAKSGLESIALGGGCLQNGLLATGLEQSLRQRGLHPLLPRQAPAGDGGLALGQAWIARQLHMETP